MPAKLARPQFLPGQIPIPESDKEHSDDDYSDASTVVGAKLETKMFGTSVDSEIPEDSEDGQGIRRRRALITPSSLRLLLDSDDSPRIRLRFENSKSGQNTHRTRNKNVPRMVIKRGQLRTEHFPTVALLPLEDIVCE
jgi:hypothetical protein